MLWELRREQRCSRCSASKDGPCSERTKTVRCSHGGLWTTVKRKERVEHMRCPRWSAQPKMPYLTLATMFAMPQLLSCLALQCHPAAAAFLLHYTVAQHSARQGDRRLARPVRRLKGFRSSAGSILDASPARCVGSEGAPPSQLAQKQF